MEVIFWVLIPFGDTRLKTKQNKNTDNTTVRYDLRVLLVCLQKSHHHIIFSQHMGPNVFGLPNCIMVITRISVVHLNFIIRSEIGFTHHCLGLSVETMVCAVCLAMFSLLHYFKLFYFPYDNLQSYHTISSWLKHRRRELPHPTTILGIGFMMYVDLLLNVTSQCSTQHSY